MLAIAGILVAGSSATGSSNSSGATGTRSVPAPLAAAAPSPAAEAPVGFVPAEVPAPLLPHAGRMLTTPQLPGETDAQAGPQLVAQHDIPDLPAVRGIPEIVLAAYRNAELRLAQIEPHCGLSWELLAGIGRIESGHADGGNTDAAGTTRFPILGPALNGTLPGNEVIKDASGGYVRAVGPMQFLPSTWRIYADSGADINNVFDAALTAGKYLCSGGLDLRSPAQELRAVLRYNNSMAYAENVLSWASIYRSGGAGSVMTGTLPRTPESLDATTDAPVNPAPSTPADSAPAHTPTPTPQPTTPMIVIPGLPPIPCGIFCPPPAVHAPEPAPAAPAPSPEAPAR